jgi:mono/diheme cytochrome c family protein
MAPRMLLLAALAVALVASAVAAAGQTSVPGNPVRGKQDFLQAGIFCSSCHTLKAARSTGRDGPDLDKAKPSYARIVDFVTNGRNPSRRWPTGMPGYSHHAELSKVEIRDIAAFVYTATHG